MDVRIDTHYSVGELQEIVAALLSSQVLQAAEAMPMPKLQELRIDFFDINYLLEPAFARLVSYSNDSRKGWFDQSETDYFYEWFALQLLRGCPLRAYNPTCDDRVDSEELSLTAGACQALIKYQHLNHPDFINHLILTVNSLLHQQGFEENYYEIRGFDEISLFLVLTPKQYTYLLNNRLVHFATIDYPEVEAWRSTIREEDLPF